MQFLIKISWFAFILISLVCSQNSNNDTIIKNDDTVIIGKVIRVTETTVEFNPEGEKPFIIIDRNDINVLIYSDHTVVNFKTPQTKHVSNLKNNSQLETLEWKLDTLYYHNPQNITQWGIVPECYRIDKYNFPDKPEFPIQANFTTLAKISARIQDKLVMFSTKDEVYKSSSTSLYYIDENKFIYLLNSISQFLNNLKFNKFNILFFLFFFFYFLLFSFISFFFYLLF